MKNDTYRKPDASLSQINSYHEDWSCELLLVNYYTDFRLSSRSPIVVATIWKWSDIDFEYSILESKEIIEFHTRPENWQWNDFTTGYLRQWVQIEKRNQQINKVLDK